MLKSFSFTATFSHTNCHSKLEIQKLSASFICCFFFQKSCRMSSPYFSALKVWAACIHINVLSLIEHHGMPMCLPLQDADILQLHFKMFKHSSQ